MKAPKPNAKQADKIAEEISQRMVDMNLDMLIAEQQEDFEQAALIRTTLDLFIFNSSILIAEMTNGKQTEIFEGLQANSNLIFEAMKANQDNLMK